MAGCTCENWTLEDLSNALQDMHKDNKRIVVPMFQRGKRWKKMQEKKFIDSLIKGYPVGTMLFYETLEDGKRTYILVDGLQRGNSIKKYMTNPTEFFYDDNISDEMCDNILQLINKNELENYLVVREIMTKFIREQRTFKNLQFFDVAKRITDYFSADYEPISAIIGVIKNFFDDRQQLYDKIASTVIPVIVYTGEENNLPEIFDRINSQGTPLDQYEVYVAAWPVQQKFVIKDSQIIEHVIRKYDTFEEDDFKIHGYNREEMRINRRVNAFEYLFGFSKCLVSKYEILAFNKNCPDDTVNPLAFELVNACLNDSDRIKILYKNLQAIDCDTFEDALYTAISFVNESVSVVTKFKGNKRNANKMFHSKYQILSMISTTFKEMFTNQNYSQFADTWEERKTAIAKNLVQYYVYDIIINYRSEGGTNKIHSAAKPNRYAIEISSRAWMVALDSFFEKSMLRAESKKVASPKSEEYVLLNCIYLRTFTAMDQLSIDKFDVEHIAPKEQMRNLIEGCKGEGLSISCIANLCYLPDYVNRSKKDRNFYQDKKYLQHIKLDEVEGKYSFTESEDLEWMDMPYEHPEDFNDLKDYYTEYCTKRFEKLKHLFCESLQIKYETMDDELLEENQDIIKPELLPKTNKKSNFAYKCVHIVAQKLNIELVKNGRNAYATCDKKKGFIVTTSRVYIRGNRERYWFAYRKSRLAYIVDCEEQFIIYGCKDEQTLIMIPVRAIEEKLEFLRTSWDDDGNIAHWHIEFYKDKNDNWTWMLSKPGSHEIGIDEYLL